MTHSHTRAYIKKKVYDWRKELLRFGLLFKAMLKNKELGG